LVRRETIITLPIRALILSNGHGDDLDQLGCEVSNYEADESGAGRDRLAKAAGAILKSLAVAHDADIFQDLGNRIVGVAVACPTGTLELYNDNRLICALAIKGERPVKDDCNIRFFAAVTIGQERLERLVGL
jgi:hypothetical protein